MKIEIHLLQNFAPSCLNRDDTNSPKQCEFGSVTRARVSSQSTKRAVRQYFREEGKIPVGERTKRLKVEIILRLQGDYSGPEDRDAKWSEFTDLRQRSDEDGEKARLLSEAADLFLDGCYSQMDKKGNDETAVLLYLAEPEIAAAERAFRRHQEEIQKLVPARRAAVAAKKKDKDLEPSAFKPSKDLLKELRAAGLSADVALFGRMLAEQPEMNTDAATQVAHMLSTHAVSYETDFYTAVDDLNPQGATGAGMMGHAGFNSACYYRYALVDCAQLAQHLGAVESADIVLPGFLEAFTLAIPTGKQNSMAAHNPPDFGLVVVRDSGVPISLTNAFADPVRVEDGSEDLIGASIGKLARYWCRVSRVFGTKGFVAGAVFHLGYDQQLGELAPLEVDTFDDLVARVGRAVNGRLTAEDNRARDKMLGAVCARQPQPTPGEAP